MAQPSTEKRHAACDECRIRKLKCSGDFPLCRRCHDETISCLYSPWKKMGRPRKRRREEGEGHLEPLHLDAFEDISPAAPTDINLASTDLHYNFDDDLLFHSPFTGTANISLGMSFDPRLATLEHGQHEHGSCNTNCQGIQDAAFFESLDPVPNNETSTTTSSQAASQPQFPTPNASSLPLGKCSCLSEMYLNLSTLQSILQFSFPESLQPIRTSLKATNSILECLQCPVDSTSAMQNTMYLTTLLTSITNAYRSLLTAIDTEAERLSQSGEKKPFRMGDSSPENSHRHTGTPDCPMGFDINLGGSEWKMLTRKVIEGDIQVPSPRSPQVPSHHAPPQKDLTVLGLADRIEARQRRWHREQPHSHFAGTGAQPCTPEDGGKEFHCLKMVDMIRSHVAQLQL